MDKKTIYENLPESRNPPPNSSSEQRLNRDNSIPSRFDESTEQRSSIQSNLSRFPDDFPTSNNDHTDSPSPQSRSPPDETNTSEQPKNLGRWDEAWKEHEQKEETIETPVKNEKTNGNLDVIPTRPIFPTPANITRIYVREFLPTSAQDPTFSILRNLFVRSFDEFYQQIETQLNLKSEKNLIQWLDETFDDEQEEILLRKYRCFLLCGTENEDTKEIVLGFLTLREEEEGSVYIAQVAVRLDMKRRGYGAQLLQHLRNLYPPNTQYWGLCRRANRPALQFYLKQGAIFMKDDHVASKYGYDPTLYAGFEFVDTVPVIAPPVPPVARFKSNVDDPRRQSATITDVGENNQNPLSTNDDQQPEEHSPVKPKSKVVGCCVLL